MTSTPVKRIHDEAEGQMDSAEQNAADAALKRHRIDVAGSTSAAAAVAAPPLSAMERLLFKHRNIPFALCGFLIQEEIADLHCTCRLWRNWLDATPLPLGCCFEDVPSRLPLLLRCGWASRAVTHYHLLDERKNSPPVPEHRLNEVLLLLTTAPTVKRLRFDMQITSKYDGSGKMLPLLSLDDGIVQRAMQRFTQLVTLHVDASILSLQTILRHIHHASALEDLALTVDYTTPQFPSWGEDDVDLDQLDFSMLKLLPRLTVLRILSFSEKEGPEWQLTPQQVKQIASCQSITHLQAGSWKDEHEDDWRDFDDEEDKEEESREQPTKEELERKRHRHADERIGELVRGVLARPALAAAAGRVAKPLQALVVRPWGRMVMTPAVWNHVSQLIDLTDLDACWSSPELTVADWHKLGNMRQLRSVNFAFSRQNSSPPFDAIFPFLPPTTTALELLVSSLSAELMTLLVHSLPRLQRLQLARSEIEPAALALLSNFTELTSLSFKYCVDTPAAIALRKALPAMPHLTELQMAEVDSRGDRLTIPQRGSLTAAILSRCPRLTRENFKEGVVP